MYDEIEEAADELHPAIPWVEREKVRLLGSGTPGKLVGQISDDEWMDRQFDIDLRRFKYALS